MPHPGQFAVITTLLTDSRKLTTPASTLFFALHGPRRNGHLYIGDLYKNGLRYFVIDGDLDTHAYKDAVFLRVDNALRALQKLAAHHRSQFQLNVIGITGSNGKTIVKEWLYQLLQNQEHIVRSPKSYNSQIGVPLSVWQINASHTLAIFEAGISRPGEMEYLEAIIKPNIGILTNIGSAHSEAFLNDDEKLQEKLQLFSHAKIIIANGDNNMIRNGIAATGVEALYWGSSQHNHLQLLQVVKEYSATVLSLLYKQETFEVRIPFIDDASIENAISCCALLLYLGVDINTLKNGMPMLQPVSMRLEFKKGINNCILINDSYSTDINALHIALDFLQQQSGQHSKTVILSDFLENKGNDELLYTLVAEELLKNGINRLIGIGDKMQTLMPVAVSGKNMDASFYISTDEFLEHFKSADFKDEAILIKGARVFGFEKIAALFEQKVHQTVLEINLDAIVGNLKTIQHRLLKDTRVMVMVKAFAYGSGSAEIANILQYHKVDYLGVAYADEGVELRKAGITMPIMVMNAEASAFDTITEHHLEPTIYSFELLKTFLTHLKNEGLKAYPVHIEIETGMNRLGFPVHSAKQLSDVFSNNELIKVQSVFSHLAASEDAGEDAFTLHQYQLLNDAITVLQQKINYPFLRHIANSSGTLRFPQLQMDMVRLGIGLYGMVNNAEALGLVPAVTLRSTIAQIKPIKAGETVSYNRRGLAHKDSVIATVRIGYGDGYSRRFGNGTGYMLVNGLKAPVIGTVCMDMTMIDITGIPNVKEGDDVVVFGAGITVQEIANLIGTIPYEIVTSVSQRVKRVYWKEG